jgi:hypothetical protein
MRQANALAHSTTRWAWFCNISGTPPIYSIPGFVLSVHGEDGERSTAFVLQ